MLSRLYKYGYWLLLLLIGGIMIYFSLDAGISGDEQVHMQHAEKVIDCYSSLGKDLSALDTPETNLKYYGQSFDNLVALIARIFSIDDIYTLRHICNSIAGWLTIVFASLIALQFGGYRAALLTSLLMFVSPRFIGHSLNNLKDIPFALGYTAFIYYLIRFVKEYRNLSQPIIWGLIASIAFTISIRAGGLLLLGYFSIIQLLLLIRYRNVKTLFSFQTILRGLAIIIAGYFMGLLFWPYALLNPILHPLKSLLMMTDYPVTIRQLFEGKIYWSDQLPWYYLIKYILISTPVVVLIGGLFFNFSIKKEWKMKMLLLFFMLFPLAFILVKDSNVYGGWRHVLFIYPIVCVVATLGWNHFFKSRKIWISFGGILFLTLLWNPISFIFKNHPYQYLYFNQTVGGWEEAYGNYEADYYFHSVSAACDWLKQNKGNDEIVVASNYGIAWEFRNCEKIKTVYVNYYERGSVEWDYAIFCNAYVQPAQLKRKLWPPNNTIHSIELENKPISIILKRTSFEDYKGYIAFEQNDFIKAIIHFSDAVKEDPGNAQVWLLLGRSYLETGNLEKAESCIDQSLMLYANFEPALYQLAKIRVKQSKSIYAIDILKEIIQQNPKYFKAYVELANIYMQLGQMHEASFWLQECLNVNPKYKVALELKQKIVA